MDSRENRSTKVLTATESSISGRLRHGDRSGLALRLIQAGIGKLIPICILYTLLLDVLDST